MLVNGDFEQYVFHRSVVTLTCDVGFVANGTNSRTRSFVCDRSDPDIPNGVIATDPSQLACVGECARVCPAVLDTASLRRSSECCSYQGLSVNTLKYSSPKSYDHGVLVLVMLKVSRCCLS